MSSVVNSYRTFIAIELPSDIRRCIKEHIDQLRSAFPNVRASWLREDNLHVTLKFLGDVPVTRIPTLSDAAAEAAHSIEPFKLIISGCGSFPPHGRPKVLWIGIGSAGRGPQAGSPLGVQDFLPASSSLSNSASRNPQSAIGDFPPTPNPLHPTIAPSPLLLTLLHGALEDRCAITGFDREPRAFHPHLTIARLRESRGSRALAEHHKQLSFAPQTFTVSELVVFRSELTSEGAQHEPLSRHKLR